MGSGFNWFRCGVFGLLGIIAVLYGEQPLLKGNVFWIVVGLAIFFSFCLISGAAKAYKRINEERRKQEAAESMSQSPRE